MAITVAPAPITEQSTNPIVERGNGVSYRSPQPSYQPRRDAPDHGRYVSSPKRLRKRRHKSANALNVWPLYYATWASMLIISKE